MKTIKLIEQDWYMFSASYWDEYQVSEEDYQKITSNEFKTICSNWIFSFESDQEWITQNLSRIISSKLERLKTINKDILDLWWSNVLVWIESYDAKRLAKIAELEVEAEVIKTELAEYEDSLVESIVDIIFA